MLTRLRISGFKNLIDVDVRFGPFTCITGANGTGKSNLFDAIRFLSALADRPLIDAALSVRHSEGRMTDIRSLFCHTGGYYADRMSLDAEMIIPSEGIDSLGHRIEASTTFVRYAIELAFRPDETGRSSGALEILSETLDHINIGDATRHLLFPNRPAWRRSVIAGRRATPFISTEAESGERIIVLHQDGGGGGPTGRPARNLPRTVLSVAAAAAPTALLTCREMQSWRLLHLEPSALRRPDEYTAPAYIGSDGAHLPATLYRIALEHARRNRLPEEEALAAVYMRVTDRLATLIDDVRAVWIDRDHRRELLTLYVTDHSGTAHPARALSDGTLRFLALAVLEQDAGAYGLLCLEEPENGIHPERIPALVRLIRGLCADTERPAGTDNPLRQVIVNTHAPGVIRETSESDLLIAESPPDGDIEPSPRRATFGCIRETWRQKAEEPMYLIPREQLARRLRLDDTDFPPPTDIIATENEKPTREETPDLQLSLFGET